MWLWGTSTVERGNVVADRSASFRGRRRGWLIGVVVGVAVLAAGCIPQGTHTVSSFGAGGISPGLWRTLGGNPCQWTRRATGGSVIAADVSVGGPRYVQVEASDGSFTQQGCVTFWSQPGPFSKALHDPSNRLAPFGQGDWLIGFEVAPGWYAGQGAGPGGRCSWSRVSGFGHTNDEIINEQHVFGDAPQLVQIDPGDFGFTSDGCGSWRRVFEPSVQTTPLTGAFKVTSVRSDATSSFITPGAGTITATFGSNSRLGGHNDCNTYGAPFLAEAGKLALGNVISTAVGCSPGTTASAAFDAALPAVVAYSFGASDLSLLDGNGATLIVLTAV